MNATEFCRALQADIQEEEQPKKIARQKRWARLDRELRTSSKTAEDGDGNVGKT